MTTLVLQAAGGALGSVFGPAGAALGRGLGALAGSAIDARLFGEGRTVEGPRLESAPVLSSVEGSPVPRAFGRVRLGGEVIWATRFEEVQSTEEEGGKGAPSSSVTSYSYFANFALALCEGEIGGVGRMWADGKPLDTDEIVFRVYRGTEDQGPDSLVSAKQNGAAPAYRGTAYIVFERLPLAPYGNRIPQIAVEIVRPVGPFAHGVRAVSIIPAASEFGYDPDPVVADGGGLRLDPLNDHTSVAATDWTASVDDLQTCCPNVERASLVVAWFGDDLRAGRCTVAPRVEVPRRTLRRGEAWSVAGLSRAGARVVSEVDGRPAYGGTPSDGAVRRAIADLERRGLRVTFNPFLLMDVAPGNAAGQPAYPWRGRIAPAGDVEAECRAFEEAYRPMVLHYARLCRDTAVDLFVIGSELRGLTHARASDGTYPFVDALRRLARDVRAILGPRPRITYGADWSEYAGHRPGNGDVHHCLDPLWADGNVDLVGIDNYLPLTDWRHGGAPDGSARSPLDPRALAAGIEGGEHFDWYYASDADRRAGRRTPITDGQGEPWVYRAKDIRAWWENPHHDRTGGLRAAKPSPWVPRSKPVAFLELGCPAVHAGANQPNVFFDPKSSESHLPHHSDGTRSDEMQAAFLEAHFAYWTGSDMVDPALTHVWAWDARPWPAFPLRDDVWGDGANWSRGHWLNGRAGCVRLRDLVADVLRAAGVDAFDVADVEGWLTGYVVGSAATPRAVLEGLLELFRVDCFERDGRLVFRSRGLDRPLVLRRDDLVDEAERPLVVRSREQEADLPRTAVLQHMDPHADFQPAAARSRRLDAGSRRDATLAVPAVLEAPAADALVEAWLHARWERRETIAIGVALEHDVHPGRAVVLPDHAGERVFRVTGVDTGLFHAVTLEATEPVATVRPPAFVDARRASRPGRPGRTRALVLNLPLLNQPATDGATGDRIIVATDPWPGPHDVSRVSAARSVQTLQRVERRATLGRLLKPLPPARPWVWDRSSVLDVELQTGALASAPLPDVLAGANAAAVRGSSGWEVLQYLDAELVAPRTYRLSGLLRGQGGTADLQGAAAQADFVRLNAAAEPFAPQGFAAAGGELVVSPAANGPQAPNAARFTWRPGARGLLPLRPVHLRTTPHGTGRLVTWIRQDRGPADDWDAVEVPMSERLERYRVVHARGDAVLATREVAAPRVVLPDARADDTVRVAQLSQRSGAGMEAHCTLP